MSKSSFFTSALWISADVHACLLAGIIFPLQLHDGQASKRRHTPVQARAISTIICNERSMSTYPFYLFPKAFPISNGATLSLLHMFHR